LKLLAEILGNIKPSTVAKQQTLDLLAMLRPNVQEQANSEAKLVSLSDIKELDAEFLKDLIHVARFLFSSLCIEHGSRVS